MVAGSATLLIWRRSLEASPDALLLNICNQESLTPLSSLKEAGSILLSYTDNNTKSDFYNSDGINRFTFAEV